ncbi:MAG: leucyl/phenylalanyl-tRNA--protein transferase [Gammaproteobacteria bacterium]|nr:leucyl/phenylalanyl-tRNA--protein transferase [Gammaproteobacteria bacterium]
MSETLPQTPFWLEPTPVLFPPTQLALTEPDGLLAVGGDLTPEWLLHAYQNGIFPWFNPGEPILWWSPTPRSILPLKALKIRRSLRKTLQKIGREQTFTVTLDTDFIQVMQQCADIPRTDQEGTWISDEMLTAYHNLHRQGYAHSVEVWQDGILVGGLYGIAIGKMFFGESMFSKATDSSKVALIALSMQLNAWGFKLIDTQVETPHLNSLGAISVSRTDFESLILEQVSQAFEPRQWQFDIDWIQAAIEHSKQSN